MTVHFNAALTQSATSPALRFGTSHAALKTGEPIQSPTRNLFAGRKFSAPSVPDEPFSETAPGTPGRKTWIA
ncbi:MAG: hypothetical protein KC476_02925 [Cyanobacteria bacterium HKST-UBA06]|nr:hypothetical protein [Cyanobacteria bacterium HKST-UBA06]